jgi:hypothetical protein
MMETLRKNSLIIAKYIRIVHVNFTVTAITFRENIGGIAFAPAAPMCGQKVPQQTGRVPEQGGKNYQ